MNITGIRSVTIYVGDLDKAKDFYSGTLGLRVVHDVVEGPLRWLELAAGTSAVGIILLPGGEGLPKGAVQGVHLETTDIVADCAALRSRGVVVDGPNGRPWGWDASFEDPDGNALVLVTSWGGG